MTAPIPVSVIVCTRNEAANLGACLAALRRFDEVWVVDSASTDGTPAIAAAHGRPVMPFSWDGRYPKKKEWSLRNLPLRHPWVLMIDADEVVTPELAEEIGRLMAHGPARPGYYVDGRYVFLGQRLRFGHHNCKLMLFDRRRGHFPPCDDLDAAGGWEVEGHYQPVLDGHAGRLRHPVLHWDRKPLAAWFDRHNRYSDWEAALRASRRMAAMRATEPFRRRWLKALFAAWPCKGLAAFMHTYVWRLGFLDGAPGLHFALARGFYYWQVGLKRRERASAIQGAPRPRPGAAGRIAPCSDSRSAAPPGDPETRGLPPG